MSAVVTQRLEEWLSTTEPGLSADSPTYVPERVRTLFITLYAVRCHYHFV
ncbi:conserved hypothetical protein [Halomonas sp. A3H3]|nr:conserved hypothetical protein [Halomonas sp. A3H3]